MNTLIKDLKEHPNWCKGPSKTCYRDIKLGQIVLDINKTLARVVHISKEGNFRLNLINETGEFASVSAMYDSLTIYKGEKITIYNNIKQFTLS